ncbi:MAG: DinB family protein [Chloroflexi bacterium]|nr:DinB family protein [Chloroflexota bacterium]
MASPPATALAERIAAARQALLDACQAVPAERFTAGPGGGEWSAAQIMAHITEAEDMNMAMVERMMRVDNPQVGRIEHYAARRLGAVAEHGSDGRQVAVSRLREQGQRFDAQVRALGDAGVDRPGQHLRMGDTTVEKVLTALASHMEDHAKQIRALAGAAA